MVAWVTNFFSKYKAKNPQQRLDESKKQNFTSIVQTVVEETILATAYWLIGLVNSSLEAKAMAQTPAEENPTAKTTTGLEELLLKVVTLIDQMHDRSQEIATLRNRMSVIEASLPERSTNRTDEAIAALETRLTNVEQLASQVGFISDNILLADRNTASLENRIVRLENLLSKYRVIPKIMGQQSHTIDSLQYRIARLESPQSQDGQISHESSLEVS